jgi:hypothetical protein
MDRLFAMKSKDFVALSSRPLMVLLPAADLN